MDVVDLELPGVKLISPRRFEDERGFFCETYNKSVLEGVGIDHDFVQDNHSKSALVGTVRGLHFQAPPYAQTKLVRVVSGAIIDAVVDVRKGSPHFGRHLTVELSAENNKQLLVPAGFLHGFITMTPNTEVIYKVDAHYSAECDGSVRWNDADVGIDWGEAASDPKLSDKDETAQLFEAFDSPFVYVENG